MAGGNNLKAAEGTYKGFVGLLKWGSVVCFIIAFAVVMMIA